MNPAYCHADGYPEADHTACPSSVECAHAMARLDLCDACGLRPAGSGHFGLYCPPCADLPYGVAAP